MTLQRKIVGTLVRCVLLVGALTLIGMGSAEVVHKLMGNPLTTSPVLLEEYDRAAAGLLFVIAVPQWLFLLWGVAFIGERRKLWVWRYWPKKKTEASS